MSNITLRRVLRAPAYSLPMILIVAMGICALAMITAFLNGGLLNAFPYPDPDRIAYAYAERTYDGVERYSFSGPEFASIRDAGVFQTAAGFGGGSFNLTGDGFPQRIRGLSVTTAFFDVFGTAPVAGRYFGPGDEGRNDLAVINERFHRQYLGGAPGVVGTEIILNGTPRTVIGVAPARFLFIGAEVFVHTASDPATAPADANNYYVIGRIPEGMSREVFADRLAATATSVDPAWRLNVTPITDNLERIGPSLVALGFAVAVLLALIVTNLAGLQLVRLERRRVETAVMLATGASMPRIVGQWLVETVSLFVSGAALGIGAAYLLVDRLVLLVSGRAGGMELVPPEARITIDLPTIMVVAAVTLLATLLVAWAPMLRIRHIDVARQLHGARQTARTGLQVALVGGQIAITTALIAMMAVVVMSHGKLQARGLGFDPDGVHTFQVALPSGAYPDAASRARFYTALTGELEAVPGVERAGGAHMVQLEGFERRTDVSLAGDSVSVLFNDVLPGYFETLSVPLVQGRLLNARDDADSEPVALVNRSFAEEYLDGVAIGQTVSDQHGVQRRIVGVVGDMRQHSVRAAFEPEVYLPYLQAENPPGWVALVVRGTFTQSHARAVLAGIDPDIPVFSFRPLQSVIDVAFGTYRLTRALLTMFVVAAAALAAVGVYGLFAQFVAQRRREIGVRTALGAGRARIAWLVLKQGLKLVVGGAALGVALALAAEATVSHLVVGVTALQPLILATVIGSVALLTLLATLPPLLSAIRTEPSTVLREE